MPSEPTPSTASEDVERLAHHAGKLLLGTTLGEPVPATLRALAKDRDALLRVLETFFAYDYGDAEHPDMAALINIARKEGWKATRGNPDDWFDPVAKERESLSAERDAARAEIARLREALELAANRLDRLTLDQPHGSARRYKAAEWTTEARAALAQKEPRHD
jgi:hypothetical protein